MRKIKLFIDSSCDLTKDYISQKDIRVIPLYINFPDESFRDFFDICPEKLYKKVDICGSLPKTSAIPPNEFIDAFKEYIDLDYDVIYIGLSSELSGTFNNAKIASTEFPADRIMCIDSLNLSSAIGLLAIEAIECIEKGMNINEVSNSVITLRDKLKTAFVIDTLDYLYKGGRCSALQHIASGVLGIKPITGMKDGKIIVEKKTRGKRLKVLNSILDHVLQNKDNIDSSRVIVAHSQNYENATYLKEKLEYELNTKNIPITEAGCVISSHCGANTVGIFYALK